MTAKTLRDIKRSMHLVASAILLAFLYTPLGESGAFQVMVRAMVVPMVTLTGLLMWQMPRIRKAARSIAARRLAHSAQDY